MPIRFYFLGFFLSIFSCQEEAQKGSFTLPENSFWVEIDIPAGETNQPNFLPFPGNYGHITHQQNSSVLVIAQREKKGTQLPVRPLGTLVIKEEGIEKNIIIATPVDSSLQLSQVADFQEFIVVNAGEKQIIQDWFLYRKGLGKTELVGWKDEQFAWNLIKKKDPL